MGLINGTQKRHLTIHLSWANYNDVSRGHPKWWLVRESPPNPLNSGLGIIIICPDLRHPLLEGATVVWPIFFLNGLSTVNDCWSHQVELYDLEGLTDGSAGCIFSGFFFGKNKKKLRMYIHTSTFKGVPIKP